MNIAEYHQKAAPILQESLQVGVIGYSNLCFCQIKGMNCEIIFKVKPDTGKPECWLCEEAVVSLSVPDAPKTPQTYKRFVVAISPMASIQQACASVSEAILKVTGVQKIMVHRQGQGDWLASIEGKPHTTSKGATHLEAIGELVMSHPELFGVEVNVGRAI